MKELNQITIVQCLAEFSFHFVRFGSLADSKLFGFGCNADIDGIDHVYSTKNDTPNGQYGQSPNEYV